VVPWLVTTTATQTRTAAAAVRSVKAMVPNGGLLPGQETRPVGRVPATANACLYVRLRLPFLPAHAHTIDNVRGGSTIVVEVDGWFNRGDAARPTSQVESLLHNTP
jgi:hypothetical protein